MAKHFGLDALLLERLRGNEFAFEFLAPKPVRKYPPRISFEEASARLKKFYIEVGCWPSTTASNPDEKRYGQWLSNQRTHYNAWTLSAERVTALNAISPTWCQTPEETWNQKCGGLGVFWRNTSRWPTQTAGNPEEKTNGKWLSKQRTYYNAGTLSAERITALNTISPTWCQTPEDNWHQKCGEVGVFWRNAGRWPSTKARNPKEKTNGQWLNTQRTHYNAGTLSAEHTTALNTISPTWCQTFEDIWNQKCGEVGVFWRNTGRWPSTIAGNIEERTNGNWLSNQRRANTAGTLSAERMTALNAISPTWRTARPEQTDPRSA